MSNLPRPPEPFHCNSKVAKKILEDNPHSHPFMWHLFSVIVNRIGKKERVTDFQQTNVDTEHLKGHCDCES